MKLPNFLTQRLSNDKTKVTIMITISYHIILKGRINHSNSTFGKLDPINAKNTSNDVYFHES